MRSLNPCLWSQQYAQVSVCQNRMATGHVSALRDGRHCELHTLYPILLHHSIISGIAALFMPRPDLRIASTIAKLDCSVFNAATAACEQSAIVFARLRHTYCIVALAHAGSTIVSSSNWGNSPTYTATLCYEHEGILLMCERRLPSVICDPRR